MLTHSLLSLFWLRRVSPLVFCRVTVRPPNALQCRTAAKVLDLGCVRELELEAEYTLEPSSVVVTVLLLPLREVAYGWHSLAGSWNASQYGDAVGCIDRIC